MRKAVLLDRDGVINHDYGYVGSVSRFEFLPQVPWALRTLKELGYATVVVSNHPEAAVPQFRVDCDCRKPKPGMLLQAAADLELDLRASIMVGDHLTDLQAGAAAHVGNLVLVGTHLAEAQPRDKLEPALQGLTYFADLPSFVRALQQGSYVPR